MDARSCLKWCHDVRTAFPNDRRTAGHTLDWIADKAEQVAIEQADHDAIESARSNAAQILAA